MRSYLFMILLGAGLFSPNLNANQNAPTVNDCRLEGKVIKVTDDDTINLLDESKTVHKIRLAGIDAPERGQPFGTAATKFLRKLINQKTVCISWHKQDRYKRLVGLVHLAGVDINHQMVVAGLAWHYKKYQSEQTKSDRKLYSDSEIIARTKTIGLWSIPYPITPSDWRSGEREPAHDRLPPEPYTCGSKRFCKQMADCAEACYYLQSCGLSRLDGNNDGVPCSNVCSVEC